MVKLFLLCASYMEKVEGLVMKTDIYHKMLHGYYVSSYDINEGEKPLELTFKVFRNFENIDFCIEMLEQEKGYYGCWKMHIFDKESKIKIAGYWDE